VLLLLLSLSLFALVSYFVLLVCYSAILLLSRKCVIKLSVSFCYVTRLFISFHCCNFKIKTLRLNFILSRSWHVSLTSLVVCRQGPHSFSECYCTQSWSYSQHCLLVSDMITTDSWSLVHYCDIQECSADVALPWKTSQRPKTKNWLNNGHKPLAADVVI